MEFEYKGKLYNQAQMLEMMNSKDEKIRKETSKIFGKRLEKDGKLFAYITNRKYVFQSRGKVGQEMAKFYLSRVGTLGMDMFLMYLLVTMGGIQDGIAKVFVQVFVIVANYILGKLLVFKEGNK